MNLVKGLGSLVRKKYRIVLRDKEGNLFKWKDIPRFQIGRCHNEVKYNISPYISQF